MKNTIPSYSAVYASDRPKGVATENTESKVSEDEIGSAMGKRRRVAVTPAVTFCIKPNRYFQCPRINIAHCMSQLCSTEFLVACQRCPGDDNMKRTYPTCVSKEGDIENAVGF